MSILPKQPGAKKLPGDKRPAMERSIAVCERVAGGMSLTKACRAEGIKDWTVLRLVAKHEALRILYEESRVACVESRVAGLAEQADVVMRFAKRSGKQAAAYVSAFATKARIAQWEGERLMPKKYGTRIDLNHSGAIDIASRLAAARQRTTKEPKP